jgi:hypothetical protein
METISLRSGKMSLRMRLQFSPYAFARSPQVMRELTDEVLFSMGVIERIQERWRFLAAIDRAEWDAINLTEEQEGDLKSDEDVLYGVAELLKLLPFVSMQEYPEVSQGAFTADRLEAFCFCLGSVKEGTWQAVNYLIPPPPRKRTIWENICNFFGV